MGGVQFSIAQEFGGDQVILINLNRTHCKMVFPSMLLKVMDEEYCTPYSSRQ